MKFEREDINKNFLIFRNCAYKEVQVMNLTADREFVLLRYEPTDYYNHTYEKSWGKNMEREICIPLSVK